MEDRKANLISILLIVLLLVLILVARLSLHLSKTFFLICGAAIAAIFAVAAIIVIRLRFSSRRRQLELQIDSQGRELRIEYSFLRKVAGVPTKFRHRDLEEATDGFRSLIGRGASGSVYKGLLSDGTAVAVKQIDGEERGERAFKSEVSAIASVQHVNLVRLLGYCISPIGPRFLVYNFVPNGSLDNWIFLRRRPAPGHHHHRRRGGCLPWAQRYRVAIDVAKALAYLHHDCRSCVLHLDVKPENILIDENFHASVADFGLSKLKGREESRVVTTIRGTRGYLAPEWILENGVSEKCDVYSYGMVLLEMIGGRRTICAMEPGQLGVPKKKFHYFPRVVVEKYGEGRLMEVVDERLAGVDGRELQRMAGVALWCIQEKPRLRPTMAQVVEMLEGRLAVEDPPSTQMLVLDMLSSMEEEDDDDDRGVGRKVRPKVRLTQMDRESPIMSNCTFAFSSLSAR